jgi:hypothetical protein
MTVEIEDGLVRKWKGSDGDLNQILGIGFDAEHNNMAALFAKNTNMTEINLGLQRTKKAAWLLMPDVHTRESNDREFHHARAIEMSNVHGVFKTALSYIKTRWESDPEMWATKKNQAGYAYFDSSVRHYGDALELINALITFVANNTADMVIGGMTDDFATTCDTAKTDLQQSETDYTGQVAITNAATIDKNKVGNELYTSYQVVHTVAELAFPASKAILDLFTYSTQFEIIHPPHQVEQPITLKEGVTKDIHNAVLLKNITNAGTDIVYMYDLDKPINDANKITFNPGDVKQNTYSVNLRFVHPSLVSKGLMKVWRVVHA